MLPIICHAAAAREVQEAKAYYAEVDPELGEASVDELTAILERARRFPTSGRPWSTDPGRRVFVLSRFPYLAVVRPMPDELRVLAVAHQHCRPGYWRRRDR